MFACNFSLLNLYNEKKKILQVKTMFKNRKMLILIKYKVLIDKDSMFQSVGILRISIVTLDTMRFLFLNQ